MTEKEHKMFNSHRNEWYESLKAYANTLAASGDPHIIKLRQIVQRPARDYNLVHVIKVINLLHTREAFCSALELAKQAEYLWSRGYPDEFIYKYDDSRRSGSATAAFFSSIRNALGVGLPRVVESRD